MALVVITPPTVEPVTVAEAKAQAVVPHSLDDVYLASLISSARGHAEARTGRSLAPKTLQVVLDAFPPGKISLPKSPVTAVSSVVYTDENDVEQTLTPGTDYDVSLLRLVPFVQPVYGGSWPTDAKKAPECVKVTYEAGWTAALIPTVIKQWILIRVASLYAQREGHTEMYAGKTVDDMSRDFYDGLLDEYTITEGP